MPPSSADKRPNLFVATLATSLPQGGSDGTIYISSISTFDGQTVQTSDFEFFGIGYISVDVQSPSRAEFISFTGIDPVAKSFTGAVRGLSFKDSSVISANKKFHAVGAPVIISFGTQDIINFENEMIYLYNLIQNASISGGVPASFTQMGITRLSENSSTVVGVATIPISTPSAASISLLSHGLTANDIISFSTTGSLPNGIIAGTPYYVLSTGLTTNNFEISLTSGGAAIVTSGTQTGVQTVTKITPVAVENNDPRVPTLNQKTAMAGDNTFIPVGVGNLFVTQTGAQNRSETSGTSTGGVTTVIGAVSITIATPGVLTTGAAHGLIVGDTVTLATTGALPTGLAAGTTYFVISAGLTLTSFELSATSGGSAINTSGAQSGTHTLTLTTNNYILTVVPQPTAYVAGQEFEIKASFTTTTQTTVQIGTLARVFLKRLNGSTSIVSGDIVLGQEFKIKNDGTNFQMLSPGANNPPGTKLFIQPTQSTPAATVFTTTVKGGTLGTGNAIRVTIPYINIAQAAFSGSLTLNYGGTVVGTLGISGNNTRPSQGKLTYTLMANGATNSQRCDSEIGQSTTTGNIWAVSQDSQSSAIDSTVDQTLTMAIITAGGSLMTFSGIIVEKIQA